MRSKEQLLEANERELQLLKEEITMQIENAKAGALYVENILGRELRTVSIAAQYMLPARHEDVTNEQLVEVSKELMVSHITLFAETEDDIIGVKSSDPHEINLSTKGWGYWYDAFHQLLDLRQVDVGKGLTLPHYWSGPIEVASSNPDHIDKWGYYYDGTTNYIIDPYFRDGEVLEYEELFGPSKVIERFTQSLEGMLEITVFNPKTFGKEKEVVHLNGNSYVRISEEPIWYGTYQYSNLIEDQSYIKQAIQTNDTFQYRDTILGKDIRKTFFPVQGEEPYVIGITYNYGLIQDQLDAVFKEHILLSVFFIIIVLAASSIYSRTITRPISYIVEQVHEIAKGNFGKKLTLKRKDEFGMLVENVNALSINLKEYTDDLQRSKEIIEFQALHDPLTSLPNRRYIKERMKEIKDGVDEQKKVALIFIDVDRFKHVNDTLGHNIGDDLIKVIGHRIKECIPSSNGVVARQGGDEFIVLLENMTIEESRDITENIVKSVKQPYLIEDNELYVSASCGVSFYPVHSTDLETLIMYADMAMYEAKRHGGNRLVVYEDKMSDESKERAKIEAKLRRAIDSEKIDVFFQPKMDASTGKTVGMEALARWTDDELGMVSPATFIPIAEDTGLIQPIWEQLMNKACRQVSTWNNEKGTSLTLAVNFSTTQFQDSSPIVHKVQSILEKNNLAPELFEVEITESVLMYNTVDIIQALRELQKLGVKIAVDDFGTGYSSLSYLKSLPINTLKIDRSFIKDIQENYQNSEIAHAVIHLAKSLKLEVVAEGVELAHQRDYLVENECYMMQGYLFSKPIPAREFEERYLS